MLDRSENKRLYKFPTNNPIHRSRLKEKKDSKEGERERERENEVGFVRSREMPLYRSRKSMRLYGDSALINCLLT